MKIKNIKNLIKRISSINPSVDYFQNEFDVTFSEDKNLSNNYFKIYKTNYIKPNSDLNLEFREPISNNSLKGAMLILFFKKSEIDLYDIHNEFGRESKISIRDPRAPSTVPTYITFDLNQIIIEFGLVNNKVTEIIIDWVKG